MKQTDEERENARLSREAAVVRRQESIVALALAKAGGDKVEAARWLYRDYTRQREALERLPSQKTTFQQKEYRRLTEGSRELLFLAKGLDPLVDHPQCCQSDV